MAKPQKSGHRDQDPQTALLDQAKRHFGDDYDKLLMLDQLTEGLDRVLDKIQAFVRDNVKGLTTSQLRNIYGRMMKEDTSPKMKGLRPLLMYVAARQEGKSKEQKAQAQKMIYVVEDLIKNMNENQVVGLKKFMEALVGYHKYYESFAKKQS